MLSRLMTRKEQLLALGIIMAVCVGAVVLFLHDRQNVHETVAPPAMVPVSPPRPSPPAATAPPLPVSPAVETKPGKIDKTEAVPTLPSVAISVIGAVESPGLYRLKNDARIQDAITEAGGATADADINDINLAAKVLDGSTLTVPFKSAVRTSGGKLVARGGESAAALNPAQYTISGWNRQEKPPPAAIPANAAMQELPPSPPARAGKSDDGLIDLNRAPAELLETLPGIGRKLAQDIVNYRSRTPFSSVDDLKNVRGIGPKKFEAIRFLVVVR